jgi:bifunctional NMN adenylyltransferase/nudix hydrolase
VTTKEFDLLVFIGRFQPLHNGHVAVIERALELSREVLVLVGSANQGRSLRNPFTYEERRDMIEFSIPDGRLNIQPLKDHTYSDTGWITEVQDIVELYSPASLGYRVGLIGHNKDNTSYYLSLFPQWGSVAAEGTDLNATKIRTAYLEAGGLSGDVPDAVHEFLLKFHATDPYKYLQNEANWVCNYQEQWRHVPYPVIFQTVDAVVIKSGHVLLVRRGRKPGIGKLALPGGFIKPDEGLYDAALRELKEETGLIAGQFSGWTLAGTRTFDDVHRDPRGRFITSAYLLDGGVGSLPPVQGDDDADEALWVPIAQLKAADLYADHYFIIQSMVGK